MSEYYEELLFIHPSYPYTVRQFCYDLVTATEDAKRNQYRIFIAHAFLSAWPSPPPQSPPSQSIHAKPSTPSAPLPDTSTVPNMQNWPHHPIS